MRKRGVINRILITFSSLILIILIVIGGILSIWINVEYSKKRLDLINQYVSVIENSTQEYLNKNNDIAYDELKGALKMIKISLSMDSIILDKQGYVYAVSSDNLNYLKYKKIDIEEKDLAILRKGEILKDIFSANSNNKLKSYSKILYEGENINGILIIIEDNNNKEFVDNLYFTIWILIFIGLVIFSVVGYYISRRIIVDPIEKINKAARRLAKGEVDKRIYIDSDDEIGELAESFNIMAESLEKSDIARRDFISNVSHELRSPITSIKGFITGIMDGIIPRDRENYYLNIVNDEICRLSRLVNDLLDISSLESGKFNLNIIQFDLNEIITLCTLNLEGKIKNKDINVEVIFDNRHEFCLADRDRIIQVLTNILENAIKYGSEGGKLEIKSYTKGDLVYVSIFNNGPTIPKENINNIWERFYKTDKSRTNKVSTGLGLPIVRLILSQHNQDIWVENVEDKGVRFTFTLKRYMQ
ncbi:HAMP domain-containing sensor histidine kinase [Clostridium sp.]|uniref:sensor histidine kinase n=1 Tax=Clostridium sp. TaxID=1506 RepID=UPI00263696C6|nr:HAMP domain-containing sensor histidine kinase [Clostridium sp.]